jgi:cyclopropane fatty-acyl-phospholipid synthase-like methyltransferase
MHFLIKIRKPSSTDRLIVLADGFLISRALYAIAELNIADQLHDGAKSAQAIAQTLHLNADALYRLLRMLAAHGVFTQNADKTFALNDMAALLTSDYPQSLRTFLLHEDEIRWQAYGNIRYTLETGKPSFNHLFGMGYFDYIARDKKRSEQFDQGMANFSETENKQVVKAFNFTPFHHIVDVGGGVGGLLAAIVVKNPATSAIVYELAHLVPLAREYIAKQGLTSQITIESGSFLESVIAGGDLYILKRILHDWDDQTSIKILQNCRNAMSQDSRLLILDCIVPEGSSFDISKDIDLIMMIIFGGKERTKKEFENLLQAAGLKIARVTKVPGTMLCAIEAVRESLNNSHIT